VANSLAALTVCECGGPQSNRHEGYLLSRSWKVALAYLGFGLAIAIVAG
jgi:hypothetical protein